jgi:hypothetical protein
MNRRHRRTTWGILVALAVAAWAPSAATANPLLSGYGGPGQGEQAILGGGLVNTPTGGGGSGTSGSAGSTASELTLPAASGSARKAGQGAGKGGHRSASRQRSSATSAAPASPPRPSAVAVSAASDRGVPGATLGISSADLLYLLLALAALALTGVLTRQLARRPH